VVRNRLKSHYNGAIINALPDIFAAKRLILLH